LQGLEREACLGLTGDTVSSFWPLGPGLGRFTFQVSRSLDEELTLEALRTLLRDEAPWFKPVPEQLCWGAIAPFEHALTPRFGEGRIWLAGDAAHSTSPMGFHSMNRGFSEVRALADGIALELFDPTARAHPFARFEREQQAEWVRLFGIWPPNATARGDVSELAPCLPASGEDFEVLLDQLADEAQASNGAC
jgi:2-polyprenyl-6-methoxyphenol hydroxylase-like FAD-dependent oxidoreductase